MRDHFVESGSDYDGPIISGRIKSTPGRASSIWIANGTDPTIFSPPTILERSPEPLADPPVHIAALSPDRVIESFRIEALELDVYDPLVDEMFDQEVSSAEESENETPLVSSGTETVGTVALKVLGPVEAAGWKSPPERAIVTELACYLALHRDRPVTGEALRLALRPDATTEQSDKTMRTYLSLLRKAIGHDALPVGTSGGYQLEASVTTDWEHFLELTRDSSVENSIEALALIRGRPFDGVRRRTYVWVFSEFLVSDMEVTIASVTTRAVGQFVEAGDLERALTALRQGLKAVSGDYGLWELYLSVAGQVSPAVLNRARTEAKAALGDDAPAS
jgi:hypothetical protein